MLQGHTGDAGQKCCVILRACTCQKRKRVVEMREFLELTCAVCDHACKVVPGQIGGGAVDVVIAAVALARPFLEDCLALLPRDVETELWLKKKWNVGRLG